MKVRIISDIHEDINERYPLNYNDDIFTIIAGDISGDPINGVVWVKNNIKNGLLVHGNHDCLGIDCEVLTENGWKFFNEISNNEKVAQYDITTKTISYALPLHKIFKKDQDTIILEGLGYKQHVTPGHDLIYDNMKLKYNNCNFSLYTGLFTYCGNINNLDYIISDNMLKLLVWVVCDGTIVLDKKYGINKCRVQFHLSRTDKISKICTLLTNMKIKFTVKPSTKCKTNKLQPYFIRFYGDFAKNVIQLLSLKKQFPKFFTKLSERQCKIILDTIAQSDGSYCQNNSAITWATTSKQDINIIQELCTLNNIKCIYTLVDTFKYKGLGKEHQQQYTAYIKLFKVRNRKKDIVYCTKNKSDVFCFTMPKGTLVTRYKGFVTITGNCVYNHLNLPLQEQKLIFKNNFPLDGNVSYLNNQYKIINDIVFIGCCLYTDYKYNGTVNDNMKFALNGLNDFKWGQIEENGKFVKLEPRHYLTMFNESFKFIKKTLNKFKDKKCVLITHHGISPLQLDPKYFTSKLNASFISNLEDFILKHDNLALVISGHVHNSSDFKIGNTRVICNPYGYRSSVHGECNLNFNPNLIVEV